MAQKPDTGKIAASQSVERTDSHARKGQTAPASGKTEFDEAMKIVDECMDKHEATFRALADK